MCVSPDRGPERLCELTCPYCARVSWLLDRVLPSEDFPETYAARDYACPCCGITSTGWAIGERSPVAFLDPSCAGPMTAEDFDRWFEILKVHQPTHWRMAIAPGKCRPATPEEAKEVDEWLAHEFPVEYMVDQDGAKRRGTVGVSYDDVLDWADMMHAGDSLRIVLKNGSEITIQSRATDNYSFRCVDSQGHTVASHPALDFAKLTAMIWYQLVGQPRTADNQRRHADESRHGRVLSFVARGRTAQVG